MVGSTLTNCCSTLIHCKKCPPCHTINHRTICQQRPNIDPTVHFSYMLRIPLYNWHFPKLALPYATISQLFLQIANDGPTNWTTWALFMIKETLRIKNWFPCYTFYANMHNFSIKDHESINIHSSPLCIKPDFLSRWIF